MARGERRGGASAHEYLERPPASEPLHFRAKDDPKLDLWRICGARSVVGSLFSETHTFHLQILEPLLQFRMRRQNFSIAIAEASYKKIAVCDALPAAHRYVWLFAALRLQPGMVKAIAIGGFGVRIGAVFQLSDGFVGDSCQQQSSTSKRCDCEK